MPTKAAETPPTVRPPDPKGARAAPLAYLLPLSLTVKDVHTTKLHIELACGITDAEGRSVQHLPLSVDIKMTVAEIEAILQHSVSQMATAMLARGDARLLPPSDMTDAPGLQDLLGQVYKGSVTR